MPKFPFPGAELPPEGGVEGGGRVLPHRPGVEELPAGPVFREEAFRHRPGIEELPYGPEAGGRTVRALAREVFHLRQRVYKLESSALFSQFGFGGFGSDGGPNELPAELELGGGGTIPRPGEINELPVFEQIAVLETRLATLETSLLTAIQALTAKVEGLSN